VIVYERRKACDSMSTVVGIFIALENMGKLKLGACIKEDGALIWDRVA